MIALPRPTLRPYQTALIDRVRYRLRSGLRKICMVAVTGAGKTVMAGEMILASVERGKRVLFLAHRTELIEQASAKLTAFGVRHGIIKAGIPGDPAAAVQVASVATLVRQLARPRPRMPAGWEGVAVPSAVDAFDLVVIDECHHATAAGYRAVLDAFPRAAVIGLTATPYRLDGSGLGDIFEAIEAGPQISELIALGFLVRPVVYAPPPPSELAQLRVRAGEYQIAAAERILDKAAPIEEIVAAWKSRAAGRLSVGFACTVEHAEHCAAAFRAAGIPSLAIDGATARQQRAQALAALADGQVQVIWNCMLLTEGWDLPACGCVILARPTLSRSLWRQMVGRGLRKADGKSDCIVLDHVGSVYRFGMPEERDEYSLDALPKRHSCAAPPTLLVCPRCDVVLGLEDRCPRCGWTPPVTDARQGLPGERRQLDLTPARLLTDTERKAIYWELLTKARDRKFSDGWAAHRYRERFGRYPLSQWFDAYAEVYVHD